MAFRVAIIIWAIFSADLCVGAVPREALRYQRELIANARLVWGLNAPVATFAAQVAQESGWRPDAKSRFAGGLAQFTPATADWIDDVYPELAGADVFNPSWALRALVRYDRWLWERISGASDCDRMAMVLAGYNGGAGWISREKRAAAAKGLDSERWFGAVALECLRARWACAENREYPIRILFKHQPLYLGWGAGIDCRGVA